VTTDEPEFLDVEDVIELHATQLAVYGGSSGLRDRGLLESALAQPRSSFGGQFTHEGLFAMASAYLWSGASAAGPGEAEGQGPSGRHA
jgi:death on curing protein